MADRPDPPEHRTVPKSTFGECLQLFARYVAIRAEREAAFDAGALVEIRIRLEQLNYLVDNARVIDSRKLAFNDDESPMLIRLYAECFYLLADRLITLCRKNREVGFSFECRPVSDIRNRLIQHPEGKGGSHIVAWTWRHEDGRGPTLEPADNSRADFTDAGLFKNADTFRARLSSKLDAEIRQWERRKPDFEVFE